MASVVASVAASERGASASGCGAAAAPARRRGAARRERERRRPDEEEDEDGDGDRDDAMTSIVRLRLPTNSATVRPAAAREAPRLRVPPPRGRRRVPAAARGDGAAVSRAPRPAPREPRADVKQLLELVGVDSGDALLNFCGRRVEPRRERRDGPARQAARRRPAQHGADRGLDAPRDAFRGQLRAAQDARAPLGRARRGRRLLLGLAGRP